MKFTLDIPSEDQIIYSVVNSADISEYLKSVIWSKKILSLVSIDFILFK